MRNAVGFFQIEWFLVEPEFSVFDRVMDYIDYNFSTALVLLISYLW